MPPIPPAGIDPAAQRAVALGIEIAAALLFLGAYLDVGRTSGRRARALVVCAVYGWALEAANIALFQTYDYPPELYRLRLGAVPLYIPLLWAVILHSSMAITDRWGLSRAAKPFADGLLALLIDVAVDAIAIRLGLWRWRIPSEAFRFVRLDEGWFGVPPGNLMAWMWVAASYSYFRRAVEALGEGGRIQQFKDSIIQSVLAWWGWREALVVALSYLGLFAGMYASGTARRVLGIEDQTERLWVLAGQVLVFLALACAGWRRKEDGEIQTFQDSRIQRDPVPLSYRIGRWAMHGSFAALLVGTGVWRGAPALLGISAVTIALEGVVEWRCRRGRGGFKDSRIQEIQRGG